MVIYKLCNNELGDILTLTLKIKEDIEFEKGIIVKLKSGIFPSLETEWISPVWTFKTNNFDLPNFFRFAHL
jgi:hypothetical protein